MSEGFPKLYENEAVGATSTKNTSGGHRPLLCVPACAFVLLVSLLSFIITVYAGVTFCVVFFLWFNQLFRKCNRHLSPALTLRQLLMPVCGSFSCYGTEVCCARRPCASGSCLQN